MNNDDMNQGVCCTGWSFASLWRVEADYYDPFVPSVRGIFCSLLSVSLSKLFLQQG